LWSDDGGYCTASVSRQPPASSVYVSCNPKTGAAHTRVLERRSAACADRRHEVGMRLRLWEMLPDARLHDPQIEYYAMDAPLRI
jgi:hypothetical protein